MLSPYYTIAFNLFFVELLCNWNSDQDFLITLLLLICDVNVYIKIAVMLCSMTVVWMNLMTCDEQISDIFVTWLLICSFFKWRRMWQFCRLVTGQSTNWQLVNDDMTKDNWWMMTWLMTTGDRGENESQGRRMKAWLRKLTFFMNYFIIKIFDFLWSLFCLAAALQLRHTPSNIEMNLPSPNLQFCDVYMTMMSLQHSNELN